MTEGLAAEGRHMTAPEPDARIIDRVRDIDGTALAVGVTGDRVLIGDPDDILGLSWELDGRGVERLAQLLVRASRVAGHG